MLWQNNPSRWLEQYWKVLLDKQQQIGNYSNLFETQVAILIKYQKYLVNNLWKKVSSNATNVARKDTCYLSVQNWGADDSEEIGEAIEENLKRDAKDNVSEEEESPLKEEENLDESSDEDEEMYSWDEIKYKANYVWFISNETVTEQQM